MDWTIQREVDCTVFSFSNGLYVNVSQTVLESNQLHLLKYSIFLLIFIQHYHSTTFLITLLQLLVSSLFLQEHPRKVLI